MNKLEKKLINEYYEKFRQIKLLFYPIFLIFFIVFSYLTSDALIYYPYYVFLFILMIANLYLNFNLKSIKITNHIEILLIIDLLTIGVFIYLSGGPESPFIWVYLFPILFSLFVGGYELAKKTAFLSSLFLGLCHYSQYLKFMPQFELHSDFTSTHQLLDFKYITLNWISYTTLFFCSIYLAAIYLKSFQVQFKDLQKKNLQLGAITKVSRSLVGESKNTDTLQKILKILNDKFGFKASAIYLIDHKKNEDLLIQKSKHNLPENLPSQISIGHGSIGRSVLSGKTVILNSINTSDNIFGDAYILKEIKRMIILPLTTKEESYGVLVIFDINEVDFSSSEIKATEMIRQEIVLYLENKALYKNLETKLSELNAVNAAAQAITILNNPDTIMENILQLILMVSGADYSAVYILNEDNENLNKKMDYGYPDIIRLKNILVNEELKELLFSPTSNYPQGIRRINHYLNSNYIQDINISTRWFPMLLGEKFKGLILLMYNEGKHPVDSDVFEIVEILTKQATISLENADLYQNLFDRKEELENLYISVENQRKFYFSFLEGLSTGTIIVDTEGKVIAFNRKAEEITGYHSRIIIDKPIVSFCSVKKNILCILSEFIYQISKQEDDFLQTELSFEKENGSKVLLSISSFALYGGNMKPLGTAVTFNDITQIREMEKRMKAENRLAELGKFASSIAHDLRSPLQGIRMFAELISTQQEIGKNEEIVAIIDAVDQCNEYISDMLIFAKGPIDKNKRLIETTEIDKFLEKLGVEYRNRVDNIKIKLDLQCANSKVNAPKFSLDHIFDNLLKNACEAINGDGAITISSRNNNNNVEVAVIDNGCGFEKDDKEKIFEAFYTTKKTGTGLGLAIVQKHILELNGQIKIESEKDLGTSIIITLPQN